MSILKNFAHAIRDTGRQIREDKKLLAIIVIASGAAVAYNAGMWGTGAAETLAVSSTPTTTALGATETLTLTGGAEGLALGAEAGAGDILGTAGADVIGAGGTEGLVGGQALEAGVGETLAGVPTPSPILEKSVLDTLATGAPEAGNFLTKNPLTTALIAGGISSAVGAREARKAEEEAFNRRGTFGFSSSGTYAGTGGQGLVASQAQAPQPTQTTQTQGRQHVRPIERSKLSKIRPQDVRRA